jgi:hypothetical protein
MGVSSAEFASQVLIHPRIRSLKSISVLSVNPNDRHMECFNVSKAPVKLTTELPCLVGWSHPVGGLKMGGTKRFNMAHYVFLRSECMGPCMSAGRNSTTKLVGVNRGSRNLVGGIHTMCWPLVRTCVPEAAIALRSSPRKCLNLDALRCDFRSILTPYDQLWLLDAGRPSLPQKGTFKNGHLGH